MSNYFDNLGRSIGPIKLGEKGVWLSSQPEQNKLFITQDKAATEMSEVYAKSPNMVSGAKIGDALLPKNQLATIEWVAWAYGVKPEFDLAEYNTVRDSVGVLNEKVSNMDSSLKIIEESLKEIKVTIASENISKLNDLFDPGAIVILKGGRAASRAEVK